ncbi:hypothetical protein ACQ4PT_066876 [Festuca glaucescens]
MAATTPGGGGTERGGASPKIQIGGGDPGVSAAGGGGGVNQSDLTDSEPSLAAMPLLEARAATMFARAVISTPAKSSHRWATALGGVELDDDIWDIRFNMPGEDNLERNVGQSDITVLNLLAMIECYGYGIRDIMYFVKEKGKGLAGMEVIDSMAKVEEMLALYEDEKCVNITVLKKNAVWPAGLNVEPDEAVLHDVPVRLSVDSDGVNYISDDDEEIEIPVAVDYSDVMYVGTQQSCSMQKGKEIVPLSDDEDGFFYPCQFKPEEHNRAVTEELELMRELKRQKLAKEEDPEVAHIMEKMNRQKKQRDDPYMHYDGDTDVEELYEDEEESSDDEEEPEPDYFVKKQPMRPGPTTRSHHELVEYQSGDFIPSTDEESSPDDLGDSDDDGAVKKVPLASGKKRKLKKMKKRIWYDPYRADPHFQFCMKLCFKNVYEFRVALRNYHIAQLRNYEYHRNCADRIIVKCTKKGRDQGCKFYLTASEIAHESTFCIRKFNNVHTCLPVGDKTKVSIDWLACQSEQAVRTDPNTTVDTLIDNAKLRFGVEVPRSKAYRARRKAFDLVMGDQKAQYTRIRDYLQAILDTNPGSRCIVTTKQLVEHPSPNPRFHGLFICLNASLQGVDGCFIKLTTGQQILAATGRDGNNNIFPIAFGVVDKEDTASWLWFLTQLKDCIGEGGQFGNYTIISDRQKGLLKAISQVFPNSPQRYCLRHIYANFQSAGFRGPELKKYMDAASYSYTKNGFDLAMEALKADCEEAYNWLVQIPAEAWARYLFDSNCKTDLVVNNISEVFNRMILNVRNKPIRTMLEGIRNKLMVKYSGTRDKAERARWEITPFYAEKLEEAKRWSRECSAKLAEEGLWQVTSGSGRVVAVDLRAKTCGCRKWDLTGVPCSHAVAAILKLSQHPEDYVHDFFKKPMYKKAFSYTVYPVPGPEDWTRTDTPDIDPPVFRDKPGRKQTVRRKGKFEVPAPRDSSRMASITCSNCKLVGHRYTNCTQPLRPGLQSRKDNHQPSRHSECSSTSAPTAHAAASASAPPAAPARPPPAAPARAPPAAAARPPPAAAATRAPPAAPAASAPAAPTTRAPPSRAPFSAPRSTTAPANTRYGRQRKYTTRMEGYLNAGKHDAYKK